MLPVSKGFTTQVTFSQHLISSTCEWYTFMITGFNTDIKHDGVVYHVQTEDKGPENPLLLSLVYVGGHILAAKRTNYAKEQAEGITEKQLQEKLEKQHKLILAIISRGRIQDLVALREREIQAEKEAKERGAGPEVEVVPQAALPVPPPVVLPPQPVSPMTPVPIHAAPPAGTTELLSPLLAQQLLPSLPPSPPPVEPPKGMTEMLSPLLGQQLESSSTQPVYPAEPTSGITDLLSPLVSSGPPQPPVSSTPAGGNPTFTGSLDNLLQQVISTGRLPEDTIPAAPPPPRITDTGSLTTGGLTSSGSLKAFREFDLDRIISEYLQTETKEEKPEIRLLGNTNFFAGDTVVLQVEVTRGTTQTPMQSTPVIVKILGTAFKPQTHSMLTGPDGIAMTTITLPNFTAGSAAIVIQTSTDSGEAEIKQLIRRR